MLLKLAVADTNMDYLDRLTSVLEEYPDLRVSIYSDPEILADAVSAGNFQALLLDPSMYIPRMALDSLPVVIMLEGETKIPYTCSEFPKTAKYQRISRIYQSVLEICSNKLSFGQGAARSGAASVIAFYSPVGGCGKTTVSLVAAAKLALSGYRVLYLDLEQFPSDGCYFDQSSDKGLSELLALIEQKSEKTMFLQSCIQTASENLHYIRHFDSPNDYNAMDAGELQQLITLCRTSGVADAVIIDMDSRFDDNARKIFDLSDKIVLVEKSDPIGSLKLGRFVGQSYIMDEYGDRMRRVLNFDLGRAPTSGCDIPIIGKLSMTHNADSASLINKAAGSAESAFALTLME